MTDKTSATSRKPCGATACGSRAGGSSHRACGLPPLLPRCLSERHGWGPARARGLLPRGRHGGGRAVWERRERAATAHLDVEQGVHAAAQRLFVLHLRPCGKHAPPLTPCTAWMVAAGALGWAPRVAAAGQGKARGARVRPTAPKQAHLATGAVPLLDLAVLPARVQLRVHGEGA
jgi:hypothetical protein